MVYAFRRTSADFGEHPRVALRRLAHLEYFNGKLRRS